MNCLKVVQIWNILFVGNMDTISITIYLRTADVVESLEIYCRTWVEQVEKIEVVISETTKPTPKIECGAPTTRTTWGTVIPPAICTYLKCKSVRT